MKYNKERKTMNDEVKEILIDLVDYYNATGTEDDPGIHVFENVVQRASKVLERNAGKNKSNKNSADIDPYAIDVIGFAGQGDGGLPEPVFKHEDEL